MLAWIVISLAVIITISLFMMIIAGASRSPENIAELVDWNVIVDEELQSYLPHKKINAIKRYRILAGVDLKEAKEAVEYAMAHPDGMKRAKFSGKVVDTDGAGVRDLIVEGRIDEAIKVYTAFMGVDEYTAHDAIETMQAEINAEMRLSDEGLYPIHDLLKQGKKIEAIKQYRELTGLGLTEARDAIENMEL